MEYETIRFEVGETGVAVLTVNRPESFNGMNVQMGDELRRALVEVHEREEVRVLVLTGAGRSFCPGADIKGFNADDGPASGLVTPALGGSDMPRLLYEAPVPTIAAVNGACAGAGLGLACACDLRLAARSAVFRSAFLSVGVAGDMGVPWSLPRLIGAARAKEVSFLDAKLDSTRALEIGLVSEVVDDDRLPARAAELAAALAAGPPMAVRALKAHYLAAQRMGFDDFVDLEFQRHFHLLATEDAREGFVAFGERRTPRFTGR